MASLETIESLAREFAVRRGALVELVNELNNEMDRVKRKYLAAIRKSVAAAKDAESRLSATVEASPEQFVKPKTLVLHGIKVGFAKGKGRIEYEDEELVVARIERIFAGDEDTLAVLLKVKKTPRKEGLETLDVATLKRLGVTVIDAGDQVVVRATDGEVDKLVAALLKDTEEEVRTA